MLVRRCTYSPLPIRPRPIAQSPSLDNEIDTPVRRYVAIPNLISAATGRNITDDINEVLELQNLRLNDIPLNGVFRIRVERTIVLIRCVLPTSEMEARCVRMRLTAAEKFRVYERA